MSHRLRSILLLLLPLTLLLTPVMAQSISASLKGSVVDPANAAIPGAELSLFNYETGATQRTSTNNEGLFVFPIVPAGRYRLEIQASGFQKLGRTNIELTASEIRDLGVTRMTVGEVREAVTVSDTAAVLQLASGEKSGLVSGEQLNELSLKGRDFMSLVSLIPGIVDTNESRETTSSAAINGVFINGGRGDSKNFTVDGIGAVDTGDNANNHYQPNMDSIAEVKVLTSNYQAEYGRNSSGLISVVTKGGGRDIHGSGWLTYRHEQFNANSFFRNSTATPKLPYRYAIGGFSIGGPVTIPKKFNTDRNRLFFFASQEYTKRKVEAGERYVNMPTALEREGDFSKSVDTNGKPISVNDPLNGGKAFPGAIIPANRFNKIGQSVLKFFPLPNYVDPDPTLVNQRNYKAAASGTHPRRNDMVRVDFYPTSKLSAYFRWIRDYDDQVLPFNAFNFAYSPINQPLPGHGYAWHATYVISPTFLNEFSLGKSWFSYQFRMAEPDKLARSVIADLPQWFPNQPTTNLKSELTDSLQMPNIQFGGTPVNPPSITLNNKIHNSHNGTWDINDNVSRVIGSHNMKAGVYVHLNNMVQIQGDLWNGVYNFGVDKNNPYNTGNGFANALLGYFNTYTESTRDSNFNAYYWTTEFFAQDNWRVNRRLTVDYGVRFCHLAEQVDHNYSIATFFPDRYARSKAPALYRPGFEGKNRVAVDPLTGATTYAAMIGLFVPGSGNYANGMGIAGKDGNPWGVFRTPLLSPAPRIGFAYDPFGNGKTVIRGGGGVFLNRSRQLVMSNTINSPPTAYRPMAYYGNLDTLALSAGAVGPSNITFTFPERDAHIPSVASYSFGVQQMLPAKMILDVSYVGNISRHLLQARDLNPIPMYSRFDPANQDPTQPGKPLPDNFFRPYAGIANLVTYEFAASANYNSLQTQVQRRMSRDLRFGAAFTWAKALGVASNWNSQVSPYFDPRSRNYGPLSFDRTATLSLNYTYTLPRIGRMLRNRPLSLVADDWTISGITMFVSGPPFTPSFTTAANSDVTGSAEDAVITVVGDPRLSKSEKTFNRNFNTDAFAATPLRSFGNAGVNILRKPGINNWDISASKSFPIGLGDSRRLMFRAESYNTFNHTQFSNLNTTARFNAQGDQTNLNFGAFTASRPGRVISFAVRLRF